MKETIRLTEDQLRDLVFEVYDDLNSLRNEDLEIEQSEEDEIFESFRNHVFIEFYYRNDSRCLTEHLNREPDRSRQYCINNGSDELAQNILMQIISIKKPCQKEIVVNNDWLKTLIINIYFDENSDSRASFVTDKRYSRLIKDEADGILKYSPAFISINRAYSNNDETMYSDLMHEINHAYENCMKIRNGAKPLGDSSASLGLNRYKMVPRETKNQRLLRKMFYDMAKFERNGHMAGMVGELQACGKHFDSIDDVAKFLRQTEVYIEYQAMEVVAKRYIKEKNPEKRKQTLQDIKYILGREFPYYGDFVRYLVKEVGDIKRKFEKEIPKISYQHLRFGRPLHRGGGLLEELGLTL